jgi:hypothetical protein
MRKLKTTSNVRFESYYWRTSKTPGHTDVCALLTAATLLLALALLALTFLFISIFLLAATALLSAPTMLAALPSSAFRFDGFVRITFCFHSRLPYGG